GYLDKQTIDALINRVGFSSRSNFYRAFKACTGKSPSDYLSQMPAD
ncbi:MAG: helix-turn-helix transcriptional regulator, partial [Bacteroidaceae bacterium]|nr:helix-turn-helix transcriptional regulator [Bacteroidaceae bacterium]